MIDDALPNEDTAKQDAGDELVPEETTDIVKTEFLNDVTQIYLNEIGIHPLLNAE